MHGSPGDPNGSIVPQQYAGWLNSHFTPGEIADPLLSDPDADPDLDGRSNCEEYVFGTNPRLHDAPVGLTVERVAGFMELTYRYRSPALDLNVTLEGSPDLASWTPVDPELVSSSQDGTFATVTRRLPLPTDPADRAYFVRVRATKTPL